jgi:transitional endoplasmic reticulum ATPase
VSCQCPVATRGLRGQSIADADAVLQRIIDAAAVRYLREGTSTITTGDVRTMLRSTFAQG